MIEKFRLSAKMDTEFEWRKWGAEIPYIKFPESWEVKIIPPFTGAIIRFRIKKNAKEDISVYLDCYDMLGMYGEPYWEVYPVNGDVERIKMSDVKELIATIKKALLED